MAAEEAWMCPVCREVRQDVARAIPCNHSFCLGCIQRWARLRDSCPLCRTAMETIRVSVRGDNQYVDCVVSPPAVPVPVGFGTTTATGPDSDEDLLPPLPPLSPEPMAAEPERVGGLLLGEWAALFRVRRNILDPVLPWLEQELRRNGELRWWKIDWIKSMILAFLCQVGPDRDVLVDCTEHALGPITAPLIDGLIAAIESRCSQEARRLLGLEDPGAAREHEDGPAAPSGPGTAPEGTVAPSAVPSSSSAGPDAEELPGTSNGALGTGPSEEPAPEAAGPSAQRRSRGPSAHGRGRKRSAGGRRRPTKRRAGSAQRDPPPCKRRRPRPL
ncbi:uncharacterized protein LOC116234809 [Phasianus colchicus]|uniref:uncharacterized protein LOC116234809 n=1 Tax=Phasianus colchicus TaxID=9054 RepID=UPI00129D4464|nr:uncharacterized protein LOC116234809 [Phasianus colchicus]XP_031458446.1 uncharacterized protein LOC116234809 [Phasianus colchicus]